MPSQKDILLAASMLDRISQHFDATARALTYLLMAESEDRPLDISSLAAYLGMSRPSGQRLVERLCVQGLCRLRPGRHDRRRTELFLSEPGRRHAEHHIRYLNALLESAARRKAVPAPQRISMRRVHEIDVADARPLIRQVHDWARQGLSDLPVHLLASIFVARPDLNNIWKSEVVHWGSKVLHGNPQTEARPGHFSDVVSCESDSYMQEVGKGYGTALDRSAVLMHRFEVEWDGPRYYDRILIPHPSLGVIGSTYWYS